MRNLVSLITVSIVVLLAFVVGCSEDGLAVAEGNKVMVVQVAGMT